MPLATSPRDGYTLGLGGIASHAIYPTLYAKLPFNARTTSPSFRRCGSCQHAGVNLDLPAKAVAELIELRGRNPGKYSYASAATARRYICRASFSR